MPLLCLMSPAGNHSPLAVLEEHLKNEDRQVPHVRLAGAGTDLTALLDRAYEGLSQGRFGVKPLRFGHYALLRRVMAIDVRNVAVERRERVLAQRLADDFKIDPAGFGPVGQTLSFLPAMLLWLVIRFLPVLVLRVTTWRRMRWFLRQRFAAPGTSNGFLSFGVRFTAGACAGEDPTQVKHLLVNAFLRDLRAIYRPIRSNPQLTAYPILLVDDVATGNAGGQLLAAVNHIRNEGSDDPLIVITNGETARGATPLADVGRIYRAWLETIADARKKVDSRAWYLPVRMPAVDLNGIRGWHRRILPPRQRWYTRSAARVGALAAVLVTATPLYIPAAVDGYLAYAADCLPIGSTGRVEVAMLGKECIGYSDHQDLTFGNNATLAAVQIRIFRQNADARARWEARPSRPLITLVFLSSLTRPDPISTDETFVAEREGLMGMAIAQRRANLDADNDPVSPYVQIVVANAGQEASYADRTVTMIKELAARDLSVMGVVAAVDSRTTPQAALEQLDGANIPVITPTMAADGIANGSSLFLRMASPNRAAAALIRHYTGTVLKRQSLFNYYTFGTKGRADENNDLYVNTLRADLRSAFQGDYEERFWKPGAGLTEVCADAFRGVVFFGGRYSEFASFVNQIYSDCSGRLPTVVADVSSARYLANAAIRQTAPATLPMAFVSDGVLGSCARLAGAAEAERQNYLNDISTECAAGGLLGIQAGGWAVMTYDATRLLIRAFRTSASQLPQATPERSWDFTAVRPPMVHSQARQWTVGRPYNGAAGPVAFDRSGTVVNRYLSMLCVSDISKAYLDNAHVPYEVDSAGQAYPGNPRPTGKPCR